MLVRVNFSNLAGCGLEVKMAYAEVREGIDS